MKIRNLFILILVAVGLFFSYRVYRRFNPVYIPIPPRPEVTLTIIPGWNLRQVADYLVLKGFASSTAQVYAVTGIPAKPYENPPVLTGKILDVQLSKTFNSGSYEGYLAPETYRVFRDAKLVDVIIKMMAQRDKEFTEEMYSAVDTHFTWLPTKDKVHNILTMASIIEKETKHDEDRAIVADILWRRYQKGWALQVDSSVHYAVDRTGDVFTTEQERKIDSPWNTYKYPGLPPTPICNPGLASVKAAIFPQKNEYWYFLSDREGIMRYAKTLDEHNLNRYKYLR
jgi:UPF0755 protein